MKIFVDADKIRTHYDETVRHGYHPGRGNKTAEQAIMAHELGHALTEVARNKTGKSFDDISEKIMKDAKKILNKTGKKKYLGTKKIAKGISGYANDSNK